MLVSVVCGALDVDVDAGGDVMVVQVATTVVAVTIGTLIE